MNNLEKARKEIGEIDKNIAILFERRMQEAKRVALYKKEHGLPVVDSAREESLIERNSTLITDENLRGYYVDFLKETMNLSKKYQHRILDGMRVAFSGVKGAFAEITAKKVFPDAITVPYDSFSAAYKAVEEGECDCAFLPIENSFEGDVARVLDLAFFGSLYINGVYESQIIQNLLCKKDVHFSEIKTVISHPQALGQCRDFISKHGLAKIECVNTAVAAKTVFESDDRTLAAIASEEAAALYNLKVVKSHINESSLNTTRFAVFSKNYKQPNSDDNRFIMLFTVKNQAGSLGNAITVIGEHGFNLRALKSRPTKELVWDYYFYVEGEGNINSESGKKMLAELKKCCDNLRVAASFEKEVKV